MLGSNTLIVIIPHPYRVSRLVKIILITKKYIYMYIRISIGMCTYESELDWNLKKVDRCISNKLHISSPFHVPEG